MKFLPTVAAALLLAALPGSATPAGPGPDAARPGAFERIDHNHDGALFLEELRRAGLDDLAFRAMDLDGDGSISRDEFARHMALERQSGSSAVKLQP